MAPSMTDSSTSSPSSQHPSLPTGEEVEEEFAQHVKVLAGIDAEPRPEQLAALGAMLVDGRRTLLVARTGFGKSAVYFSATRILRDRGWGPTVVVSPLLALMRDQVAAAELLGLRAVSINSSNLESWSEIERTVIADQVDLLLISPERLANDRFRERVFSTVRSRPFALVCDEAHCISDWGHDFRPDYRRLRTLLNDLPSSTPVLATTATANQRVTDDVASQLGQDTFVLRTSLDRASLHLSVVDLPDDAHRLAWLAQTLPSLNGSGIVYCLTVAQAETTAKWLGSVGIAAAAYSGGVEPARRLELEDQLRSNQLKALVATSALGMGFDKGDMAFCIHLGLPPSPVAYYQQIGRAGRAISTAEVIAVPRPQEDAQVWRWFESVSLPPEDICFAVLDNLHSVEPTSIGQLEVAANLGRSRLGILLSILDVDGAVERVPGGWVRTGEPWVYNAEAAELRRELRRDEANQMLHWASRDGCRLRYLRESLDDSEAADCGRCDQCTNHSWQSPPDQIKVAEAADVLRGADVIIEPRKQWPTGVPGVKGTIKADYRAGVGRALARLGDGGWNPLVQQLIDAAESGEPVEVSTEMARACASILKRWNWDQRPTWICPMPSRRRQPVIDAVADALGSLGKLPIHRALTQIDHDLPFQSEMSNSAHQAHNALARIRATPELASQLPLGPVLLIDDESISRWTLAVAANALVHAGSGPVLPFTLRSF
ncbi:MAG: ATP-dependent DNA helicase RecQ [Acidimicrobiales bacterium]|nr:ATP-dependent DNA helicase RecQ [Acidimicrobiales bacterium]